jgi:hypothetical protein
VLEEPRVAFVVVKQDELDSQDPRTGYATPTVLVDGADLFGLDEPKPPYAAPS